MGLLLSTAQKRMRLFVRASAEDPDFLADAKKLSMEIDPLTGEQVQEVIARVMKTPEPIAARVRKALEPPK